MSSFENLRKPVATTALIASLGILAACGEGTQNTTADSSSKRYHAVSSEYWERTNGDALVARFRAHYPDMSKPVFIGTMSVNKAGAADFEWRHAGHTSNRPFAYYNVTCQPNQSVTADEVLPVYGYNNGSKPTTVATRLTIFPDYVAEQKICSDGVVNVSEGAGNLLLQLFNAEDSSLNYSSKDIPLSAVQHAVR